MPGAGAPSLSERRPLHDGETLEVFRVVHVPDPDDPDLWRSFRSRAEEGKVMLGEGPEAELDHESVSVWSDLDQARGTVVEIADRFGLEPNSPDLKIGRFVAHAVLDSSHGVLFVRDDEPVGHVTIWGEPEAMARSVVATHPVWET